MGLVKLPIRTRFPERKNLANGDPQDMTHPNGDHNRSCSDATPPVLNLVPRSVDSRLSSPRFSASRTEYSDGVSSHTPRDAIPPNGYIN